MKDTTNIDYSLLDNPEVLAFLFYPRSSYSGPSSVAAAHDELIPVDDDVVIGARFHMTDKQAPNILFFHGNGEIVDDYDDLGPVYNQLGINFLAVDYRGYGHSSGSPSSSSMLQDSHVIFDFVRNWLGQNDYSGAFIAMGRSLGSASVLDLVSHHKDQIAGLILESGFAYTGPLLKLVGIDTDALDFTEGQGFRNLEKIKTFDKPTLIIHAEHDHIIPYSDGAALYDASPAQDKTMLKIPQANHNNIFALGFRQYMDTVRNFVQKFKE